MKVGMAQRTHRTNTRRPASGMSLPFHPANHVRILSSMNQPSPAYRDREAKISDWEACRLPAKIQKDVAEVYVVVADGDHRGFWRADTQPRDLTEELEDLHQCIDLLLGCVREDDGVVGVQADL